MSKEYYLCFDIGGTNIKYGVLTETGKFIYQSKLPTRRDPVEDFIGDIANTVKTIEQSYPIKRIGISFPGFINPKTGFAEFAGAFDILHGKNILDHLKD